MNNVISFKYWNDFIHICIFIPIYMTIYDYISYIFLYI